MVATQLAGLYTSVLALVQTGGIMSLILGNGCRWCVSST
jgi:hypothetical protein